jgi:hypothetical protein
MIFLKIKFRLKKWLLFFLIFVVSLNCSPVVANDQSVFSDKVAHFYFSFLALQYFKNQNYSLTHSATCVLGLGLLKEGYDFCKKRKIEGPDFLFDLLGVFLGVAINL